MERRLLLMLKVSCDEVYLSMVKKSRNGTTQ